MAYVADGGESHAYFSNPVSIASSTRRILQKEEKLIRFTLVDSCALRDQFVVKKNRPRGRSQGKNHVYHRSAFRYLDFTSIKRTNRWRKRYATVWSILPQQYVKLCGTPMQPNSRGCQCTRAGSNDPVPTLKSHFCPLDDRTARCSYDGE